MHVIYIVTYLPHLNTNYPKWYVGSKYNYRPGYFGSVASNQIFDFTDGLSLKNWWKTRDKKDFKFEVVTSYTEITPNELVLEEKQLHERLNVKGSDYFNQSIATTGFCSVKKSEYTKSLMSEKMKLFWNSKEGYEKKQRLIQRNKLTKSKEIKLRYKDPKFVLNHKKHIAKVSEERKLKLEYNGKLFRGWDEFTRETGVSRYKYLMHYKRENNG